MLSIAEVSDRIGEHIGEQAGLQSEVKKICYGVECFLVLIISIGIIFMLGGLCSVFMETALITLAALLIKHIIGGPHLSGFLRCTSFSAIIFISFAWVLKIFSNTLQWWLFGLTIVGSLFILFYIPMSKPEFNYTQQQIRHRKISAVIFLIILASINSWHFNPWLAALIIGALLTVALRTPAGVLIIKILEKITKGKEATL